MERNDSYDSTDLFLYIRQLLRLGLYTVHNKYHGAAVRQYSNMKPAQPRGQAGNVCKPLGLYTFSNGATVKRSQNRFPTQCGGFRTPGTGGTINVSTAAESAAPADTAAKSAAVSATPADTASEDGPLTSSPPSRGQSSGGALCRPVSCCCIAVQQRHDICYVQCTTPAIKAVLCIEINQCCHSCRFSPQVLDWQDRLFFTDDRSCFTYASDGRQGVQTCKGLTEQTVIC